MLGRPRQPLFWEIAVNGLAYVNGEFLPLAQARVSVLDRGFLFADGVYEVAAVIQGTLIDNGAHLARLRRSLAAIELDFPLGAERIIDLQKELIRRNGLQEGIVYLQITRGAGPREFAFLPDAAPTLVMFTQEKNILDAPAAKTGIAVKTLPDIRWARRDVKSVALLAQVLAKQAAVTEGAQEAWMFDDEGMVTEGSSSNCFIVTKEGALVTRPNSTAILPGCTRQVVLQLAAQSGIAIEERRFSVAEALEAAEAFITSASTLVTPVVRIDGAPVGAGVPGEKTKLLRKLYIDFALQSEGRSSPEKA